jgi:LIVCS family branched-chain amino acid:cation transporter
MAENLIEKKKESRAANIVFSGFMIFGCFFGAGNMIFPAYLGVVGGSSWMAGLIGFTVGDAVLGVLALGASAFFPRTVMGAYYRVGYKFMVIWGGFGLFLGSVISVIPRCVGVTFENGLHPIINLIAGHAVHMGVGAMIPFFIIYLALACFCVIRPTKIIDVLGKILTPILIVVLIILYIMGYAVHNPDSVRQGALAANLKGAGVPTVFAFGLNEGYQTQDSFTGALFALVIVNALIAKGYKTATEQQKMLYSSGLVAVISCFILYLGLTGLGAIHSSNPDLIALAGKGDRTGILNYVVSHSLGGPGIVVLGLVVLFATFTTAVGAGSMVSTFFSASCKNFFGGKLTYKVACVLCFVIGFIMDILLYMGAGSGVTKIIVLLYPLLIVSTPMLCGCILGTLFGKWCKNDNMVRGSLVGAFIAGAFETVFVSSYMLAGHGPSGFWLAGYHFFHMGWNFPSQAGLSWLFPTIICLIIGALIPWKGKTERPFLREHSDQLHLDYYEALAQIKK